MNPTLETSFSHSLNSTPALELKDITKRFSGKAAVQSLSLNIRQGELYALLGSNGAGKTTTLRMIAGLLEPDAGQISILGFDVALEPEKAKMPLAYLPDDPLLYAKLRPMEYLEFVAGLWGLEPRASEKKARELLEWLDLWKNRFELTEGFSRGMKQKLALAGALVHSPQLMILDEPLTGLDAGAARQVKDLLVSFVAGGGTVILTTHILEVAERLAQRIGILSGGKLIAEGTLEELRTRSGENSLEDVFLELTQEANP